MRLELRPNMLGVVLLTPNSDPFVLLAIEILRFAVGVVVDDEAFGNGGTG